MLMCSSLVPTLSSDREMCRDPVVPVMPTITRVMDTSLASFIITLSLEWTRGKSK